MMAAARPRISVVVDESTLETLRRVAVVQGRSVSSVVGEMCQELEPGLRKVAELGEAYAAMSEAQKASMRLAVESTDERVARPLGEALEAVQSAFAEWQEIADGRDDLTPPR